MPIIDIPGSVSTGGVCSPWATEADLCDPCSDYDGAGALAADMLQAASDVLFELSGRQFPGTCSAVVRPCARRREANGRPESATGPPGWVKGWGWCGCGDGCSCEAPWQIDLGAYPITSVTQVKVDGAVLSPTLYRVDDWRTLVRLPDADGSNPGWPKSQRLDLPATAEGTWSVAYEWGREPPPMGVRAAAVLACELALACDPDTAEPCRLPKKVTAITREGITMVLAPSDFLTDGKVGIWEIDLLIRTYNPSHIRQRAQVWTPTMAHHVRPGT